MNEVTNTIRNEVTYTLQSTLNGKYINQLFTNDHYQAFQGHTKNEAYGWNSLQGVHMMRKQLRCCIVVRVEEESRS